MQTNPPPTTDRWTLSVLFLISAVILGFEILLTRIFSVILFASHSFIAIALALLGVGAGAALVYLAKPLDEEAMRRRAVLLLALMAGAIVIGTWGLLQIEFIPRVMEDPETGKILKNLTYNQRAKMVEKDPGLFQMWKLFTGLPLAFLPFLFGGYLQAMIFKSAPARFGRLYGVDLIGATLGSVLLPLLLFPLGLYGTLFVMTLLTVLPIAALVKASPGNRRLWAAALIPLLLFVGLKASGTYRMRFSAGFSEKQLVRAMWSPLARVAVIKYGGRDMYVIDNGSRTFYVPNDERNRQRYSDTLYSAAFEMKRGGEMLVIASGGGQELMVGHQYGMKRIDAVEIARPIVTDILTHRADDPGNPYKLPGVVHHVADGRAVALRAERKYDIVQMLEVNFHTLAGQIANAWSPNLVFTQEAFAEYLDRVKDDGYVCYTVFSRSTDPMAGKKLRRFVSMVAGMKMLGIEKPEDHVIILAKPYVYGNRIMVMIKRTPFEPAEVAKIARLADARNAKAQFLYPDLRRATRGTDLDKEFIAKMQPSRKHVKRTLDVSRRSEPLEGLFAPLSHRNRAGLQQPLTDDRPYMTGSGFGGSPNRFEKMVRGLYETLLVAMGILALLFVVLPFVIRRPGGGDRVKIDPRLLVILACTGIGFLFLEMAGIFKYQLYLHHPTIAMIVVLSSMILGAGLGSLHSARIAQNSKERSILLYALGGVVWAGILFAVIPVGGHALLLSIPLWLMVILTYLAFGVFGFLLGHVVPLTIDRFAAAYPNLIAWCWAVTVTGSVFGTVFASILARDFGIFAVSLVGMAAYALIVLVVGAGLLLVRKKAAE